MQKNINCQLFKSFVKKETFSLLILEGSKSVNKILMSKFSEQGFLCFSTTSIKEAKKILKEKKIDYLILDIHLEDGSGYELIKELEKEETKIFVLTSEKDKQLREISFQKGVIDYIVRDKEFFSKIEEITSTIMQLEKNRFKTLLIVDDSFVIQEQLQELFQNRNYNVLISSCASDAYKLIQSNRIDLILLDLELKDTSGLIFLQKNRKELVEIKKIPVMIISGNIDGNTIRDALKAGAVDIVKKPYITEELILKVDLWIEYNRREQEIICNQELLQQYKDTVDRSSIVSKADKTGKITYVNDKFCEISGFSKNELIGQSHSIVRHPDMSNEVFEDLWETIKTKKQPWKGRLKNKKKDGSFYWVDSIINPIVDVDGNIIEFIGIRTDVTEQVLIKEYFEKELNIKNMNFQHALKLSKQYELAINESNILSRTNLKGTITYVNDRFCQISGYSKEEVIGRDHNIVRHPDTSKELFKDLWRTIQSGKSWFGIIKNKRKDNTPYWVDTTIIPIRNSDNQISEYMAIRHDITRLYELQEEKEKTYLIDDLTLLRGRNALNIDLKEKNGTLLLLDIFDFNRINTLIGYEGANEILVELANLIKDQTNYVYRLHVDVFAIFYENRTVEVVKEYASRVLFKIDKHRFMYKGLDIPVSVNIGISDIKPLHVNAEIAITKNKNSFNKISIYDEKMDDKETAQNNFSMLNKVKIALQEDLIRPFFQPIVNLETKEPIKYEALVRLIDEDKAISPFFFLDIAKKSKLYPEITKRVFKKSIEFMKRNNIPVSINISYQDVMNIDVLNYISIVLQANKDIAPMITFEILESDEIDDYEKINSFIKLIKKYGSSLAIDDFGSGYSNFTQLLNMEPDIVKIDGSLIKDIHVNKNSRDIVESILILTKKRGIEVVAEFIDNEEVHEIVKKLGVDYGQGFLYSPPIDLLKKEEK